MFRETTTSVTSRLPSDFASLIGGKSKSEARLEKISWTTEPDILSHTLQTPQYKYLILVPLMKYPKTGGGMFCMGAQARTDILPYISLIPVFGYFMRGTSTF